MSVVFTILALFGVDAQSAANTYPFPLPGQGDLRNKGHLSHQCVAYCELESLGLHRRQFSFKPTNPTPIGANNALC
jgi:hypothetical protein